MVVVLHGKRSIDFGGPGITDPRPVFAACWEAYRLQHGQHVAFNAHNARLGNLMPLMLHGDEGRSLKKAPFLITSIESPIGGTKRPEATAACSCGSYMRASPHLPRFGNLNPNLLSPDVMKACREMFTNYRGHSFLSRFFLFGVGGWVFKKNPHVVEKLFAVLVEDLQKLFTEGFEVNGVRYWAACIACKGDMDFFYKYFNLERCYTKIMARSLGYLCHECLASGGANNQMPFEDFGDDPRWVASMFTSRPWSSEPQLAGVPYDPQAPEGLLKYDLFHVVKLGLARDVIGGVICTLARKGFFDFEGSARAFTDSLSELTAGSSCFALRTN